MENMELDLFNGFYKDKTILVIGNKEKSKILY